MEALKFPIILGKVRALSQEEIEADRGTPLYGFCDVGEMDLEGRTSARQLMEALDGHPLLDLCKWFHFSLTGRSPIFAQFHVNARVALKRGFAIPQIVIVHGKTGTEFVTQFKDGRTPDLNRNSKKYRGSLMNPECIAKTQIIDPGNIILWDETRTVHRRALSENEHSPRMLTGICARKHVPLKELKEALRTSLKNVS